MWLVYPRGGAVEGTDSAALAVREEFLGGYHQSSSVSATADPEVAGDELALQKAGECEVLRIVRPCPAEFVRKPPCLAPECWIIDERHGGGVKNHVKGALGIGAM